MVALVLLVAAVSPVTAAIELRNKLDGADRNLIDTSFLTDVVRQHALQAAPSLKLMTRENVLTHLEASGKKLVDCENECEVETGRALGAAYLVTGEVLRFGGGYRVNLRLHHTRSAQLLAASVASGETAEWRLQDRLGLGLYGVVYPIPEKVELYDRPSAGAAPTRVLAYTLPWLTVNASTAFYF